MLTANVSADKMPQYHGVVFRSTKEINHKQRPSPSWGKEPGGRATVSKQCEGYNDPYVVIVPHTPNMDIGGPKRGRSEDEMMERPFKRGSRRLWQQYGEKSVHLVNASSTAATQCREFAFVCSVALRALTVFVCVSVSLQSDCLFCSQLIWSLISQGGFRAPRGAPRKNSTTRRKYFKCHNVNCEARLVVDITVITGNVLKSDMQGTLSETHPLSSEHHSL